MRCLRCGHEPCPGCTAWCEVFLGEDQEEMCCDGECVYEEATVEIGRASEGKRVDLGGRRIIKKEDGIRDLTVTGVQTCALPIYRLVRSVPGRGPGGDVLRRGVRVRGSYG